MSHQKPTDCGVPELVAELRARRKRRRDAVLTPDLEAAIELVGELRARLTARMPEWWRWDPDPRAVMSAYPALADQQWAAAVGPRGEDRPPYILMFSPAMEGEALLIWRAACDDLAAVGAEDLAAELVRELEAAGADVSRVIRGLRDDLDLACAWPWRPSAFNSPPWPEPGKPGPPGIAGGEVLRALDRVVPGGERPIAELVEAAAPTKAPAYALVAVNRVPRQTMTALGGGKRERDHVAAYHQESRVVLTWPDNTQLDLPWTEDMPGGVMHALGAKYGRDAVRDLVSLYALGWAARAPAGGTWWWWPAETVGLCGYSGNDAAARVLKRIRKLAEVKLTVGVGKQAITEALVLLDVERVSDGGRPMRDVVNVRLARQLWTGMTSEAGALGSAWSPVPLALLNAPSDGRPSREDRALLLLPWTLGFRWRAGMHRGRRGLPDAYGTVEGLTAELGLRTERELVRTLDRGVELDVLGAWTLKDGQIHAEPSSYHAGLLEGEPLQRLPRAPSTGPELLAWCKHRGIAEAARELNVSPATLRQWRRRYPLVLPWTVRRKVLAAIWPGVPWPKRGA